MLGLIALYFALTLLVLAFIGGNHWTLVKLSEHGRQTTGIVSGIQPGHSVDARRWVVTRTDRAPRVEDDCEDAARLELSRRTWSRWQSHPARKLASGP